MYIYILFIQSSSQDHCSLYIPFMGTLAQEQSFIKLKYVVPLARASVHARTRALAHVCGLSMMFRTTHT